MVHPDTEIRFVNDNIGWGVFATRTIPRGTIVWALDALDQRFTPGQVAAMPAYARAMIDKYSYIDGHGRHILCWDHARYFNHSCAANCLSVGYDFELAVRDIAVGEELTDDYGTLNPLDPFACLCGANGCRAQVLPDDFIRLGDRWNTLAREAFFRIPEVAQPLWEVVSDRADIEAALANPNRLRTIHHHYHSRPVPVASLAG